ncbi:hypothetical protein C8Q77DRAFT_179077 [Trametes polyzona]|nr:hypothetical protein C8Q77DRAFT_179077 [Trametes polyzona]
MRSQHISRLHMMTISSIAASEKLGNWDSFARPSSQSATTTMFATAVQPSIVSLFSSTGSEPLSLFSSHTDTSLPTDSLICLLNDATSEPKPPTPKKLIDLSEDSDEASPDYPLGQTVLHIQSPTIRKTYIRSPPAVVGHGSGAAPSTGKHLGLKHPWIHLQVRNLHREWAFEVGLVDQSGREGIVRCATFQVCILFVRELVRVVWNGLCVIADIIATTREES